MANEADEPAELTIKKLQLAWEMIQKTAYHDLGPQLVDFRRAYRHISQTVDGSDDSEC